MIERFIAFLNLLFTPRRSFAYRLLEKENLELRRERDEYREKWIEAVDYIQRQKREPGMVERPRTEPPPSPVKRLSWAEIEAEHQREARERFEQFRLSEANALPNEPDVNIN